MQNRLYIYAFAVIILFQSCEDIFLEKQPKDNPESNFELFWNEFDAYYALFDVKGVDWEEQYNRYRSEVNSETSRSELWDICTRMIEVLDDSHTFMLDYQDKNFYLSGDSLREQAEKEFSLELVRRKYLESGHQIGKDTALTYGKIKNEDLGYIHFYHMRGSHPDQVTQMVKELQDTKGMIVDMRNNGGGDDVYSHRAAGAFADGKHFIYTVQTKNGPGHGDFDEITKWYSEPKGDFQYLKPIVLLTDRKTISAGEIFCFNMRSFAHVTHIGDYTSGAQSDLSPIRHLPNGWVYGFSYQKYLTPDGKSLEGVGFEPDIIIRNTESDILNDLDIVLERAIEFLVNE